MFKLGSINVARVFFSHPPIIRQFKDREQALSQWTNGHISISEVLSLFWAPRAQFWFLYALFFVSLVGIPVYKKTRKKFFFLIAIVSTIPNLYFMKINTFGVLPIIYVLGNFCFFALGIFFKEIHHYVYNFRQKLLIPSFAIFVGAQYLFHGKYGLNYTIGGAPVFALAFVSIVFMVVLCMCMEYRQMKILSLIGSFSMVIYLAHILVGSGLRIFLTKILHVDSYYPNLFLGCIFGILLPIIASKLAPKLGFSFIFTVPSRLSIERLYNDSLHRIR
ncbi:MAG: acyltransferase family protein [Methylobacter sp.]